MRPVRPWTSLGIAIASGLVAICVVVLAILTSGDAKSLPSWDDTTTHGRVL